MKKACSVVLVSALLILVFSISASANSWGLRGDLLDKVSNVNTWNDYGAICEQAGDAAVMGSRYHNALMLVEDGRLKVYTTAVYQPGSQRESAVSIEKDGDALILAYPKSGKGERYVFSPCQYGYCLTLAMIGDYFTMELVNEDGWERFKVYDGEDESYLSWIPYLSRFNIELFPRSVDEVKHLNDMLAVLDSGSQVLPEEGLYRSNVGKGTAPVYSAPFGDAAWRAGKGKASVGLRGEFWTLKTFAGSDGETYTFIKYDVSERTQRFGYVRSKDIKEEYDFEMQDDLINVDLVARRDTYLTDDPDVSQYPQFKVPEGTQLKCMAVYDEYAYVSANVKDGEFADGGQIVWGFVPIMDLDVDPAGNYYGEVQQDAMNRLEGAWRFYAGGNQAQDKLIFYPDGTYQGVYAKGDDLGDEIDTGVYTVRAHNPDCNLYWNDPPYELTLMDEDGTVNIKGLTFGETEGEETFSLSFWEGGGGYQRIEESEDGGNG